MARRAELSRKADLLGLAGFVLACAAVSAIGGAVTATSVGTWYQGLAKPPFNPPDGVFGPVWTALYVAMAFAAWRVWRGPADAAARRRALAAFWVQLALNLLWSILFFGLQAPGIAFAEVIVLLCAIAVTTVLFWRRDRVAGLLFLPYLAWVAFASVLNGSIWMLN